jgi:hypothetical protein
MEAWVNQVLAGPAEQHASGLPHQQPLQPAQAAFKGLLKHGLTKAELAHAGLGAEAVDRLYRTLYVYSVGLFDTLQVRGASMHEDNQEAGVTPLTHHTCLQVWCWVTVLLNGIHLSQQVFDVGRDCQLCHTLLICFWHTEHACPVAVRCLRSCWGTPRTRRSCC